MNPCTILSISAALKGSSQLASLVMIRGRTLLLLHTLYSKHSQKETCRERERLSLCLGYIYLVLMHSLLTKWF